MTIRQARTLMVAAACLTWVAACSTSAKLADAAKPETSTAAAADSDVTGSVAAQPSESAPRGEPVAQLSPLHRASAAANSDVQLGQRFFRAGKFDMAAKSYQSAVEKRPSDAEAWIGLGISYDRLHRFDLADHAYAQAVGIAGPTAEILNDQGFSYLLRGDYARAKKSLEEAEIKEPANPYVQANLDVLRDGDRQGRAIQ